MFLRVFPCFGVSQRWQEERVSSTTASLTASNELIQTRGETHRDAILEHETTIHALKQQLLTNKNTHDTSLLAMTSETEELRSLQERQVGGVGGVCGVCGACVLV